MQTMIDTRVPICRVPGCSGALDKGFMNVPGEYQGTYFFCTNCGMRYLIKGQGQAENELLCEYDPEQKLLYLCDVSKNTECKKTNCHINGGECYRTYEERYRKES